MSSLLTIFVLLLKFSEVYCIQTGKFIRFNGYKLSGAYSSLHSHYGSFLCAGHCLQEGGFCESFNFNALTGECQLNCGTPNTNVSAVEEVSSWLLYVLQKDNDWELVFRAEAGNNLSPYEVWMGTISTPSNIEDGCLLMTKDVTCSTIYRSPLIDVWNTLGISEVQVEMYKSGSRVVRIRFDGTGTTYTNWFSQNNIMDSDWSTFSKLRTFNYFTLYAEYERSFFINQNYGGCPVDAGWMVVIDLMKPSAECEWDKQAELPAFLYASGENVAQWETHNYGKAEILAVFIKR